MNERDYTATIEIAASPKEVFDRIQEVTHWWSRDFEGSSTNLHDAFVICHPGRHYSEQHVVEVVPERRIVWLVTDSRLDWLEHDKHEWTDTRMVFELTANGDRTVLRFTHEGLVPEKECYARCAEGWSMVIKQRLFDLITEGKVI